MSVVTDFISESETGVRRVHAGVRDGLGNIECTLRNFAE